MVVGAARVSFNATPARPGDCFSVTDMLGMVKGGDVCVGAKGMVQVDFESNGRSSGPVYLMSTRKHPRGDV